MVRHIWLTILSAPPEQLRSLILEVFYDGADEPSVSVPVVDFFGAPHGRPVDYESALTSILEGRGFNLPADAVPRPHPAEIWNAAPVRQILYYQIDYTLLAELPGDLGLLHATFRENPTTLRRDFVIADGFRGPGGSSVQRRRAHHRRRRLVRRGRGQGVPRRRHRPAHDLRTGLEDYVGSAWGLGRFHSASSGAPLVLSPNGEAGPVGTQPDMVGFYRWHLADPIMFEREVRVTIQQIGAKGFAPGQEAELEAYSRTNPVAGNGCAPVPRVAGVGHRRAGRRLLRHRTSTAPLPRPCPPSTPPSPRPTSPASLTSPWVPPRCSPCRSPATTATSAAEPPSRCGMRAAAQREGPQAPVRPDSTTPGHGDETPSRNR